MKLKGLGYQKRCALFSLCCVLPWILGFFVFSLKPMIDTLVYSFCITQTRPDASMKLSFVGLDNYTEVLFRWNDFMEGLFEYASQIFLMMPMIVIMGLLIALLLNAPVPGRKALRALYFLPVVLLQGPLMQVVSSLGGMRIPGISGMFVFDFIQESLPTFLSSPIMYIVNQFILIIWYSGVQILICLAGLQKQDKNMYEAAGIDGASAWQSFWKITLPILRPFILLSAIYTIVDLSTADMNPLIALIKDNMYTRSSGFGFPAAITWLYFLVMLLVTGMVVLLLGRREKKERVKHG